MFPILSLLIHDINLTFLAPNLFSDIDEFNTAPPTTD